MSRCSSPPAPPLLLLPVPLEVLHGYGSKMRRSGPWVCLVALFAPKMPPPPLARTMPLSEPQEVMFPRHLLKPCPTLPLTNTRRCLSDSTVGVVSVKFWNRVLLCPLQIPLSGRKWGVVSVEFWHFVLPSPGAGGGGGRYFSGRGRLQSAVLTRFFQPFQGLD